MDPSHEYYAAREEEEVEGSRQGDNNLDPAGFTREGARASTMISNWFGPFPFSLSIAQAIHMWGSVSSDNDGVGAEEQDGDQETEENDVIGRMRPNSSTLTRAQPQHLKSDSGYSDTLRPILHGDVKGKSSSLSKATSSTTFSKRARTPSSTTPSICPPSSSCYDSPHDPSTWLEQVHLTQPQSPVASTSSSSSSRNEVAHPSSHALADHRSWSQPISATHGSLRSTGKRRAEAHHLESVPLERATSEPLLPSAIPRLFRYLSRPLRILSLDNGVVKGLAQFMVLERLFTHPQLVNQRPADFFDLIVGSGSGAILAVLLGRLRLPLLTAKLLYTKFLVRVFAHKAPGIGTLYHPTILETFFLSILQTSKKAPDALLATSAHKCQVVLTAARAQTPNGPPRLFRSYNVSFADPYKASIVEALRASFAIPKYFGSYEVNGIEYVSGSVVERNPAKIALDEAKSAFPGREIGLIISIGGGVSSPVAIFSSDASKRWGWSAERFNDIFNNSSAVEADVKQACKAAGITYARWNPSFPDIPDDAYSVENVGLLRSWTEAWLDSAETLASFRETAKRVQELLDDEEPAANPAFD